MEPFQLKSTYNLTKDQIESYQQEGHILIRNLAGRREVEYFREAIKETVIRNNYEDRPMAERDTYGKAFLQIKNLWRENDIVRNFVLAKRFGEVAARLMGVERVRLYHDQALFKEPGGGKTPWHQDQFYWPLDTDMTITMWMPLLDITADMGLMQFASGSHKNGYITAREISDESDEFFNKYIVDNNLKISEHEAMHAGDATFHSGWILHNALPNQTDRMREVMTIIYYPDGTRIMKPDHEWRQKDLEAWMGGKAPGKLATSHLNPIIG